MAELHPFFIHYPIALYTTALIIEIIKLRFKSIPEYFSLILIVLGAFSSLFASFSGDLSLNESKNIPGISDDLSRHELLGNILTWIGIISAFTMVYLHLKKEQIIWLKWIILITLSIGILVTGYFGGQLVVDYGAGTKLIMDKQY
ncbi:MAG: hypothetical protein HOK35_13610 [Cytophagia bacterium]|jgi:uncharacterized membrane protein|nr:hypothetical protein [Cytophagia bacterium]